MNHTHTGLPSPPVQPTLADSEPDALPLPSSAPVSLQVHMVPPASPTFPHTPSVPLLPPHSPTSSHPPNVLAASVPSQALAGDSTVQRSTRASATSISTVISVIMLRSDPLSLKNYLRSFELKSDVREEVLAGALPNGGDPLNGLDIRLDTLGVLYILSARLHVPGKLAPSWNYIEEFCSTFTAEQARTSPDRVTLLATGIVQLAEQSGALHQAIQPLYDILVRYPPTTSHLTTIHPIFLKICVSTRRFSAALPILSHPLTTIDTGLSDLTSNDNLVYHYSGGMAYATLGRWADAAECFEICACAPGVVAAGLQFEALKKMVIVQLISEGKMSPFPKYIHASLPRLFKNSPYAAFAAAYPAQRAQLQSIVEVEHQLFATEEMLGLMQHALARAPRWAIQRLTETYLTLHLADIALAAGLGDAEEARNIVLDMITTSEIAARLTADGTVTFADLPKQIDRRDVDVALVRVQEQGAMLTQLDREMACSSEFLDKAIRNENSAWGVRAETADEERAVPGTGSVHNWVENAMV